LVGRCDHAAAPAVDGGIQRRELAAEHVGLPTARAEADRSDLAARAHHLAKPGFRHSISIPRPPSLEGDAHS
jgi:hypothetical protein